MDFGFDEPNPIKIRKLLDDREKKTTDETRQMAFDRKMDMV